MWVHKDMQETIQGRKLISQLRIELFRRSESRLKAKNSHADFKNTKEDFLKGKRLTLLRQLTATPAFPTPHVLAQFASKAYTNYK